MLLHAFYNFSHIGDVLLVRLTGQSKVSRYVKEGDLCILYHNDEVIGYNLMNASQYITNLKDGQIQMTPQFVEELNKVLSQHQQNLVESDYDNHIKVAKVVGIEEHPDSDHMHICQVDVGNEVLQIVCGAPNVALNQVVVAALDKAVMPSGLIIRPSKLRGVESKGMLCSPRELGIPNAPQKRGILVLNEEEYHIGESFWK